MSYRHTHRVPLLVALAAFPVAGCQSGPAASAPPTTQPAARQVTYTPDGDRLGGPIPGNHWPFTLVRGGGGGGGSVGSR